MFAQLSVYRHKGFLKDCPNGLLTEQVIIGLLLHSLRSSSKILPKTCALRLCELNLVEMHWQMKKLPQLVDKRYKRVTLGISNRIAEFPFSSHFA